MSKKLAVCVPYRDRKKHLEIFVPYITQFLSRRGIDHKIFICHQTDNKLFNRGKTKNIAYQIARDEGFDYFAFHDIDLLPEDDSCDYSCPAEYPIHLGACLNRYGYELPYEEFFGACVLFTGEQFELVNGYYNDYWGWGYEDDDLFYRICRKGMADIINLPCDFPMRNVVQLNGRDSYIRILNPDLNFQDNRNGFSIMLLIKPEEKDDPRFQYLVGDDYSYFEFPILSLKGRDMIVYNKHEKFMVKLKKDLISKKSFISRGMKNEWSLLFLSVDPVKKRNLCFLNGNEVCPSVIRGMPHPYQIISSIFLENNWEIGRRNGLFRNSPDAFLKGRIAQICLWDGALDNEEAVRQINHAYSTDFKHKVRLLYDFESVENGLVIDKSGHQNHGQMVNCTLSREYIGKIIMHCRPYRRFGEFSCLSHFRNAFKQQFFGIGANIKLSDVAADNERIFKTSVRGCRIDPDRNGLNNLSYKLIGKETIYKDHVMISVEC